MENEISNQETTNNSTYAGNINGSENIEVAGEKENWVAKAIEREAIPKPERKETVEEFAKAHGIDTSTYYYQMRKKENKKRIVEIWLNEALDDGNRVLKKLRENALEGREKSIELYMKFVLELAENLDIKSDGRAVIINQVFYDRNNDSTQISTEDIPITISPSISESEV